MNIDRFGFNTEAHYVYISYLCIFYVASDPLQNDGCKLSVLFSFHINSTLISHLGKHPLIIRPLEHSLYLPGVTSFLLVAHLPRLVAMVAKSFMCERKVSNLINCFLVCFFLGQLQPGGSKLNQTSTKFFLVREYRKRRNYISISYYRIMQLSMTNVLNRGDICPQVGKCGFQGVNCVQSRPTGAVR